MKVFTVKARDFMYENSIDTFYFAKEENAQAKIDEINQQIKAGKQYYSCAWMDYIVTEDD